MEKLTRRDLLKTVGAAAIGILLTGCRSLPIESSLKEQKINFAKNPDGTVDISQETLTHLDNLKDKFPIDQWNQYGEGGTFDGVEVTAGENRQAFVTLDLWRADSQTPWGDAEVKTIVSYPQSISLKEGFQGTGWIYPKDIKGYGWDNQLVIIDSAAGIQRRINQGENIADAMVVPLGDTGNYILVKSDGSLIILNDQIAWQGKLNENEQNMVGIRGLIPLSVLLDLGLASLRRK